MKDKVTKQATEVFTTTKRVVGNAEHFVLAVALLICATYNYLTLPGVSPEYYIRLTASVIIALKGTYEVIRFFNKEAK
ncbi:hypothetical protein KC963_01410 [Candidatus Saccharibacteria bacterium]|nr:hypothetical protein [Candidatus Saccharibacteria bacterium]